MAQYSDDFIERLHLVWGPGFLSPGGPEEVAQIVRGLDLRGRNVLDIGCGTGGPSIVLARDLGARLTCVDVEEPVLQRARALAGAEGLSDAITFRLVKPGPLPFPDAGFDVVFSKDALIHVPDKHAIYLEILRVLKPGGVFAASDWLSGEGAAGDRAFQRYRQLAHLDFTMATERETIEAMRAAGFSDVETQDRNAWYKDFADTELAEIEGPLRHDIIAVSSRETYENWLAIRRSLAAAVKSGSLRPTHMRGHKPDTSSP